jgi:hypothetical protein
MADPGNPKILSKSELLKKIKGKTGSFKKKSPSSTKSLKTRFVFKKKTNAEISRLVDFIYPIKISNKEEFINRIYSRYPMVDKSSIALIVKIMFETMRLMLILGAIFKCDSFFTRFLLYIKVNKFQSAISIPKSSKKKKSDFNDV